LGVLNLLLIFMDYKHLEMIIKLCYLYQEQERKMHIDESKRFDKRNIQRNVKDGTVAQKDLDVFLSRLPDVSNKIFTPETDSKEAEPKVGTENQSPKSPVKKKAKGK